MNVIWTREKEGKTSKKRHEKQIPNRKGKQKRCMIGKDSALSEPQGLNVLGKNRKKGKKTETTKLCVVMS